MMDSLLDPQFLLRLERLELVSRRLVRGRGWGQRRASSLGSSIEFADYRPYYPGDDLRMVDWNAHARLGRLFLKLFLDEQELAVTIYLDASRSMTFGQPAKLEVARRLAAALGYVALAHQDRVAVRSFDRQILASLPLLRGKGAVHRLLAFLEGVEAVGEGDLGQALRRPGGVPRGAGLSILLSDFLFPGDFTRDLLYLQGAGQQVVVVQILDRQERDPSWEGDLRLVDGETGEGREVAFNPQVLGDYRQEVAHFTGALARFCFSHNMGYLLVEAETPVEEIIWGAFRQAKLLR